MRVRIGHRGDHWFELGPWHALAGEALRFADLGRALLFLRECGEDGDLRRLRGLLAGDDAMTRHLDDRAVLRLVAHRLHARTLKAVALHDRRFSFTHAPVAPPRVELPAAEPRSSAPEFEPRRESTWLDIEPAVQARTLRAAARSAAPFCEICERTRKEAPPPPPPGAATAQAQVLREAARTAAPFCEQCQVVPASSPAIRTPAPPAAAVESAAQAQTLREAARSATPFCEVCRATS